MGKDSESSLQRESLRRRVSESELAPEPVTARRDGEPGISQLAHEARRQSVRAGDRQSEKEALDFLEQAADTRGWE